MAARVPLSLRALGATFWVALSSVMHGLLLFGLFGGLISFGGGERGRGYNGHAIELSIAGPEADDPEGAEQGGASGSVVTADPRMAVPIPSLEEQRELEPQESDDGEVVARRPARQEPSTPRVGADRIARADEAERPESGNPEAAAEAALGEAEAASGDGSRESTVGTPDDDEALRAALLGSAGVLGTGASAQALLPNGGRCADPVAGVWRTQKYRAGERRWIRYTLRVNRSGNRLEGSITSRIWSGPRTESRPGPCTPFGSDHTWRMQARGFIDGDRMTFGATSVRMVRADCPSPGGQYFPDNFSGPVDTLNEVFRSVNNDGGIDVNEPYTFRRTACE